VEIDILGIDLAKLVFQLHGTDRRARAVHRAKVSRGSLFESAQSIPRQSRLATIFLHSQC
jgi:transposase